MGLGGGLARELAGELVGYYRVLQVLHMPSVCFHAFVNFFATHITGILPFGGRGVSTQVCILELI